MNNLRHRPPRIENSGYQYCVDCEKGTDQEQLEEVGKQLLEVGYEVVDTEHRWGVVYSFHQCSRCGHIWQYKEVGGAGGGDDFYTLLTRISG